jgi:hypothetical protein
MESSVGWSDFLVASAGATAALAGLVALYNAWVLLVEIMR